MKVTSLNSWCHGPLSHCSANACKSFSNFSIGDQLQFTLVKCDSGLVPIQQLILSLAKLSDVLQLL